MNSRSRWVYQPQKVFLRRAIFQIHLWTGIALAVWVVVISVSGSVLVYRDNIYQMFSPKPVFVKPIGVPLSDEQLQAAAGKEHAGFQIVRIRRGAREDVAVTVSLQQGKKSLNRLFNPYTGEDLGSAMPLGFRFTDWLLDFHDNLLSGRTGRTANGVCAVFVLLSAMTGMIVWWPGIQKWKRSLKIDLRSGWKQGTWTVHSALGFWFVGFVLMWGITGTYLAFEKYFNGVADYIQPVSVDGHRRLADVVLYWLAYAHFGRFGGRIPGCARNGICNSFFKATWSAFGAVPVIMAVTGVMIWWNRTGARRVIRQGNVLWPRVNKTNTF